MYFDYLCIGVLKVIVGMYMIKVYYVGYIYERFFYLLQIYLYFSFYCFFYNNKERNLCIKGCTESEMWYIYNGIVFNNEENETKQLGKSMELKN